MRFKGELMNEFRFASRQTKTHCIRNNYNNIMIIQYTKVCLYYRLLRRRRVCSAYYNIEWWLLHDVSSDIDFRG